jgi:hypothetical protein
LEIESIINAIRNDRIRITDHAWEEAQSDELSFDEIISSVINGKIIEDYPKDSPFPSCLVHGFNYKREPIHSVWGYNLENKWTVLITVYRPDPNRWVDWETRRK